MARAPVSKTEHFSFLIKERSEKTPKFSSSSINRLGRVSECRRGALRRRGLAMNSEMAARARRAILETERDAQRTHWRPPLEFGPRLLGREVQP
jgi:hypothetical protein